MRSVGWAFALYFWTRHRLLMWPILGYMLVLVVLVNVLPAGTFRPENIAGLSLPLWSLVPLLTALFSYGDKADLLARESGYPRRLFSLPLRTAALVGWPLAIGSATLILFWLLLGGLILRAAGVPAPLFWLAVFLAALLAWVQAVTWIPFPLPFLRAIVTVLIVGGMIAGAILGFLYQVAPMLLLAVSAGLVPAGYFVAVAGVSQARRGDIPVWHWPIPRRRQSPRQPARRFTSATDALFWLEWRRAGYLLPMLVGLLVLPQMLILYFAGDSRGAAGFLIGLFTYPLVMAIAGGSSLGNFHPSSRQILMIPAFIVARPVPSAELLAVKFRVAARTTLVTWAMILVAVMVVLPFSPAREILLRWARHLTETQGMKGWAIVLLFVVGPPLLTWKWLVNQLWIGLTGRNAIVITMSLVIPFSITGLGLFAAWVYVHPEAHALLRAIAPWVVGPLLFLKLGAGVLVARTLLRQELVTPGIMTCFGSAWIVGAALLFALAFWLMPPDVFSPLVIGSAAVLLGLPLVRLGLAPLALEWNRHR